MTTAQARAVPFVFANLRLSLMATASAGLLTALAQPASAASCVTSNTVSDVCIINLANITDTHDGQGQDTTANGDTLQFNDNVNPLTVTGKQFGTGTASAAKNFVNFEFATVINNTTLTITSTTGDLAPTGLASWTIDAGSTLNVSGTGGNALGDTAAMIVNGTFNVIESETVGSLAGSGSVVISAAEILTAGGNSSNTTFSGIMSGAGGFTKAGNGTMILSGANTFTGALAVTGGVLEIGNANAISTASAVNISAGTLSAKGPATYTINAPVTITTTTQLSRLTGNAIINNNVQSNGGLQPGNTSIPTWPTGSTVDNPGQDMGQITITGSYEATGSFAYVGMFIDIDAALAVVNPSSNGTAGTTHDFLSLNTITGTVPTKFSVASFDEVPVGGVTTGNGIQVINIAGVSANAGNEFYQGNAMVAGPHQYLLRYVANHTGTQDGYFLQSAARDEIFAQAALLSAGQSLIRGCFRDDQRIPDSPKGATYGRAWFGYRQGSTNFGADTGVEQDQDFSCSTGGMDWRMGAGWFGGISGGFGSSNSDITVPSGTGQVDGDARVVEAYAAFTSSAFFLNLSAGYADMDWTYLSRFGSAAGTSGGFIGSAQAGVGLGLEPLAVKLIGMINYDGTNCGDDCFGVTVSEDTGLIEAKGALRFDGVTWGGSIRPWAQVAYSTVLSDGVNTITAGPYTVVSDTNDELLSIDAGLQSYLDENLALYLDGGYHESLSKDISGYRAGIGMKLYW
ncbi:MAG: autotransporter domain-containing protein [Alphaproteobacteria bacterium]|nr:autotransporter domain-containing protein [Alphaproteobacteria bacterium]